MIVFILAMTLYPSVMRKAQAEIDAVVGRDRVPNFRDEPSLPYIRAIVKETLRWRPVGPLGMLRSFSGTHIEHVYCCRRSSTNISSMSAQNCGVYVLIWSLFRKTGMRATTYLKVYMSVR